MSNSVAYKAEDLVRLMESMKIVGSHVAKGCCTIVYNNNGEASADIDKKIINIPRIGEANFEALQKLRTFVYHEAGHIRFTLIKESDRPKGQIFKIYNALEDVRMETLVSKDFIGCKDVLEWACDYFNRTNGAKFIAGEVDAPLWEALCAMIFTAKSRIPSWTMSDKAQWYFDKANDTFQKVLKASTALDCAKLALEIWELLKDELNKEKEDKKQDSKDSSQDKSKGESSSNEPSEEGNEEEEGKGESKPSNDDSDGKSDEDNKDADGDVGEAKKSDEQSDKEAEAELNEDLEDGSDFIEDLKSEIKDIKSPVSASGDIYTSITDNDVFSVPKMLASDYALYETNSQKISGSILGLTRNLDQALRFLARVKKHSFLEEGRIDMNRLAAIAKGTDKRVFYSVKNGVALNTALEIVIDQSGSMSGVISELVLLVMALGESLTAIGCPFEIFGASTSGVYIPLDGFTRTQPIIYNIFKVFNEQWSLVKNRINRLSAQVNHIDGEVIEFAGRRLLERKEKRKVIFALSDGIPQGNQGKDAELGENLKNVCKRLRSQGIEVYGFGIKTKQPKFYYGEENFIYLEDATKMSEIFFKKLAQVIALNRFKI